MVQVGAGKRAEPPLPYARAIALLQSLPLLAAPRQKLQLFCDACAEVARCAEVAHHEATAAPRPAEAEQCEEDEGEQETADHNGPALGVRWGWRTPFPYTSPYIPQYPYTPL